MRLAAGPPRLLAQALLLATLVACGGAPPRQPPGAPPTPLSVSREEPGGDAHDPHAAALGRLLGEPWGFKVDRYRTLRVDLPDWRNWKRVRFWGFPTRAGFRYGDDHHAVGAVLYLSAEGQPSDPDACLARFEEWAAPKAKGFSVTYTTGPAQRVREGEREVLIKLVDAQLTTLFKHEEYAGAYAAYPSWPDTCLIQGFSVRIREQRELAMKVRDRWVREAAAKLAWLVGEKPSTDAR